MRCAAASATSKKVVADTVIGPGANEWYGTLINSNIRYDDGSAVYCANYLGVKFVAPKATQDSITLNALLSPWQQVTPQITTEPIDDKTVAVTVKVNLESPHTFGASDTLTWGINGNLTDDPDKYTSSFEFYADELPSGSLEIQTADAPDSSLASATQVVYLSQGSTSTAYKLSPGETQSFDVPSGNYTVTADDLSTSDQTVVAAAQVSPSQVTVQTGETATIEVTYGEVQKYSGIDFTLGEIQPPVDKEQFHVTVIDSETGKSLADFSSPDNHKTELRKLPASATVDITAEVTLNNTNYYATKTAELNNDLVEVNVDNDDIHTKDIDTTDFATLTVTVKSDDEDIPDGRIALRLTSSDSSFVYTQDIPADSDSTDFDEKIAPGTYSVQAKGFVVDSVVYGVQAPASLTVEKDGSAELELTVRRGANLKVHGFPGFLSFGALSDLVDLDGGAFVSARASAAFKYAGNDGAGDPGSYLTDDPATTKTVELAANVEAAVGGGHTVLPVMISYTCNLSLGDTEGQLQNKDQLAHSFGNLILSLNKAKESGKEEVPAGYVINPDFLGEVQKGPDGNGFSPSYSMPVREPLQEALDYRSVEAEIPDSIDDTLKGYVAACNWLIRTVAEKVTFGWQVNLWGVGNSEWVYSKDPSADGPAQQAKKTADYIKTLDVYTGECKPDFLAIDRYEADDFTQRAYVNGYCYGPYEWGRFWDFCGYLSLELQVPVMPWQIPASRIPNKSEEVVNLESEHWGTGGTYIFGDPAIGSDYTNIHPTILAIKPSSLTGHPTVEDIFATAVPFDLSGPKYDDFPLRGIFTVLLGGGATTGIVTTIGKTGPWTQDKINKYMDNPIPLDGDY